jgi:5-methylcytosine-specific restriction enzyme subunit McrC
MRTISLTEHEPANEHLSADELRQLLSSGLVNIRPLGQRQYQLLAGSNVGTAVFPSLRVLIRPKVGVKNLLFLLSYATGLLRLRPENFPYSEDQDLLSPMALMFDAALTEALGYGLARDYRDRRDDLATIRGRIDIGRQLAIRPGMPLPVSCRFQAYTEDSPLNRVLKAGIRRVASISDLGGDTRRSFQAHARAFATVSQQTFSRRNLPDLRFNRLNEIWRSAGELATLILQGDSVRDQFGESLAPSFIVDMNLLFERFIGAVISAEVEGLDLALVPQARRRLSKSIRMRPDLVIRWRGRDVAVGDAKYKELSPAGWENADLYQLLAYCVALGLPRGLLIYAGPRAPQKEVVFRQGTELEVIGVDLAGEPDELMARSRAAAQHLVEQALEFKEISAVA